MMEDTEIITEILFKLDGWVLDNEENRSLSSTKYNKKVTSEEVLHYYDVALDYALSYTNRDDFSDVTVSDTAVILWSAGLIWNKYNVRSNNQIDETNTLGFGDKLIVQAKEILKPFKSYSFHAY